jgi:hypothetical protein
VRNYLYLWNNPAEQRLVASGIEFRDLLPELRDGGGIILLRHKYGEAESDLPSRLDYVLSPALPKLAEDNIYSYGDFCWADFSRESSPRDLADDEIAELLFFAQMIRPLRSPSISGLQNRFLWDSHDDGWYSSVSYADWSPVETLLRRLLRTLVSPDQCDSLLSDMKRQSTAIWCQNGNITACEPTHDIDALQEKHLAPHRR